MYLSGRLILPAFLIKLALPNGGALFFFNHNALLVRDGLDLGKNNSVALGGEGCLALLLVLGVINGLIDGLGSVKRLDL
jgi:hypothetical protein